MHYSRTLLLLMMWVLVVLTGTGRSTNERQKECKELRCGHRGPPIRFPFRLIDLQPHHCAYPIPSFHLSCSHNHQTLLHLPTPSGLVQLSVKSIDYKSQQIQLYDPSSQPCLPSLFLKLHHHPSLSSIFPFISHSPYSHFPQFIQNNNITFLSCPSSLGPRFRFPSDATRNILGFLEDDITFGHQLEPPQDMLSCPIYAFIDDYFGMILESDLLSCTKMFEISSNLTTAGQLQRNSLDLVWLNPNCSRCEANGMKCGFIKNNNDIQCLPHDSKIHKSTIIAAAGSTLLLLLLIAFFLIFRYFRTKGEDEARVENFLQDYRAFKPTRFSYADLKRITNYFKHKLGEGAHGVVFKGKLSNEILVAVKILNNSEGDGKEFINEVGIMGKIHHVNVVRLLGFCADGFHRALVYDFFPKGSLQNFISPPENKELFLGWDKLEQIALGMAKGIEYLHQGCDQQILHFDINPHNVLLDNNFTPKISDFGLAKLCTKNQSAVSITAARGTLGYIAPEVFSRNFGNVSCKSDVYSYGMLLLEMVAGRKNTNTNSEDFQILYPEWVHNLVEGGDTHINIEDEEDIKIARKLAIVGLWCIQWHPVNRPSMKNVVQMLEGDEDKLKVPPILFDSTTSGNTSAIFPPKRLNLELETIHELE